MEILNLQIPFGGHFERALGDQPHDLTADDGRAVAGRLRAHGFEDAMDRLPPPGVAVGAASWSRKSVSPSPWVASARRFSNPRLGWKFSTCKSHSAVISSARLKCP